MVTPQELADRPVPRERTSHPSHHPQQPLGTDPCGAAASSNVERVIGAWLGLRVQPPLRTWSAHALTAGGVEGASLAEKSRAA